MRIALLFSLFLMVVGCKDKTATPLEQSNEETSSLSGVPDFDKFYYRFHVDSIFQLTHISFPLEGIPSNFGETEIESYKWQETQWVHHSLITDAAFESKFQIFDETLITEYIIHKDGKVGMKRRFSKSDDGWFLIYYAGMNPIEIN